MLYIYLDTHSIKVLLLKKGLLGHFETSFSKKVIQVDLLKEGKPENPDVIASAVKDTLEGIIPANTKEKNITLVLPQESFSFFRTPLPGDIAPEVIESYLKEKVRTLLKIDIDTLKYDYVTTESAGEKQILFYAIDKEVLSSLQQPFSLLDYQIVQIIPETLTYYKLFEKTLRSNKKETIWYVSLEPEKIYGYLFDSHGLMDEPKWTQDVKEKDKIETILQKKASQYVTKNIKLNRLIISGEKADSVRQDTFTKEVGVWTNPLKRIISHFYVDYLKLLGDQPTKPLAVLDYDMLIGAFIFDQENKSFSILKDSTNQKKTISPSSLSIKKLPLRNIMLALISFLITFAVLYLASKSGLGSMSQKYLTNIKLPSFSQATPTPTLTPSPQPPTPTPTPAKSRKDIKIKVLNGSGIVGKASVVKEYLKKKGYEDIITANADTFDYETTVLQTKKGDTDIKDLITKDIQSQIENKVEFEVLSTGEVADAIIIVGTDFK